MSDSPNDPTRPLPPGAPPVALSLSAEAPPRFIGPYQVVKVMGEGGMGVVYLAERAEKDFSRQFAIKVVKRGMDSESIVARFRRERQILSGLIHPHIAQLVDGGSTVEGLPYFVMEHIEGLPITEYCNEHNLSTRARLELFQKVCGAVQFAHQNLVVHRDLKPSNILVTQDGTPKLLDFGIAKLLKSDSEDESLTGAHERLMTPAYASPEQARGDAITTASDIYSLGVILYELLCGRRPFSFAHRSRTDIDRILAEEEPRRPSTAVVDESPSEISSVDGVRAKATSYRPRPPKWRARELKGDLDNIVLLALRKEPQLRYPSADALAADLRRYLEDQPVSAQRPTFSYRAGKYLKRHKAGTAVAVSAFALLIAFTANQVAQSRRLAEQRDAAEKARLTAVKVTVFLENLFEVNDPSHSRGKTLTAREILEHGASRLEKDFADEPEVQAELMNKVGNIYETLGLYEEAEKLLSRALALRQQRFGAQHLAVAEAQHDLAHTVFLRSRYPEAEKLQREALSTFQALAGSPSVQVARALDGLAQIQGPKGTGKLEEAEKVSREALAMNQQLFGAESLEAANAMRMLGYVIWSRDRPKEAEPLLRGAVAMTRRLLGADHPLVAVHLKDLAGLYWGTGDPAEGERLIREALEIDRQVLGNEHFEVADCLNILGVMTSAQGRFDEAEKAVREALAINKKVLGPEHREVGDNLNNLAFILTRSGKYEEAIATYFENLAIISKTLGEHDPIASNTRNNLGASLRNLGRYAEAEKVLLEARTDFTTSPGLETLIASNAVFNLGLLYWETNRLADARAQAQGAWQTRRKLSGEKHPEVLLAEALLAEVDLAQGDTGGAAKRIEDSMLRAPEGSAPHRRARGRLELALGGALLVQRHFQDAESHLLKALEVVPVSGDKRSVFHRLVLKRLAQVAKAQKKPHEEAKYVQLLAEVSR